MLLKLKDILIGPPLPTRQLHEKKLNKIRALAAFSPDALSSIAYANQEIYLGLIVAGSTGLALAWPIGLAITALLPAKALLERAYPNPFNPSATIAFFLERTEEITLTVHDILGRPVASLLQGRFGPGRHVTNFDGEHLSAGMYLCILRTRTAMESQRLVLLR